MHNPYRNVGEYRKNTKKTPCMSPHWKNKQIMEDFLSDKKAMLTFGDRRHGLVR